MEKKINLVKLLKDCPKGMELDCTCANYVVFDKIIEYEQIKCVIGESHDPLILDKYGRLLHICCPKCVIFPKGKTTWEGFQKPFKDGDILYIRANFDWVYIYKEGKDTKNIYKYAATCISSVHINLTYDEASLCRKEDILKMRIATEEEKQKLFDSIKANGYRWNEDTNTLENLVEPKFKVGDRIKSIGSDRHYIIKNIKIDRYILNDGGFLKFTDEHIFELVPNKFDINTLKPFESKVLVRNFTDERWKPAIFGCKPIDSSVYTVVGGIDFYMCIPYENNAHLINTTNNCDNYYKTWEK